MRLWDFFRQDKKKGKHNPNILKDKADKLSKNLDANVQAIEDDVGRSADIVVRRIKLGDTNPVDAALIFVDGLANKDQIISFLEVLLIRFSSKNINPSDIRAIKEQLVTIGQVKEVENRTELLNEILKGCTVILVDNVNIGLAAVTKGWEKRAIAEPENQLVIRGPREGFTENIRTNTSMIRRIVSTSKLRLEQMTVGTLSESTIGIMYIEGIASEKLVREVKHRLKKINTDSILGVGYLEDYIEDNYRTLFPQVAYTERPDTASASLFEGRVIILLDGTPFVMVLPVNFFYFFQSPDDYYLKWQVSSFLRVLRMITFFISLSLPSLYVGITTFHPELIPTTLVITLASQREGVPFPTIVEALLMELSFEILKEAGIRMPRAIGQAVSIVGALVIGTAAVEAGIVSSAMVIIVAVTGISAFTIPYIDMANAARLIRFIWLVLAASFGLIGILFGFMLMIIHLSSLRSFGHPYLEGVAPFNISDQKDLFIRAPRFFMKLRPRLIGQQNPVRQDEDIPTPANDRQRIRKDDQDR